MTPAEAAIREALDEADAAGFRTALVPSSAAKELLAELDKLRALCACAYQLAGVVDAPLPWLDALSEAANGLPFSDDGLLPVGLEQLDEFGELHARCEVSEALLREMLLATQQNYSGDLQKLRWETVDHLNKGAGRE